MASGRLISYLRVSTDRQGASGLGVDAQRATVLAYLNGGQCELSAEYVEVESGRKSDRAALRAALDHCHREGGVIPDALSGDCFRPGALSDVGDGDVRGAGTRVCSTVVTR